MAILPIIKYPDPILKDQSNKVLEVTTEIKDLVSNLFETMYDAPGIGLAAPQVGILLNVCVVDLGKNPELEQESKPYALINPTIVHKEGSIKYEEGCLSMPGIHEIVERPSIITIKALNQEGAEMELKAEGLLAVCIQHEIDHLNGVLFTDRLTGLKKKLMQKKLRKLFPIDG